MQIEKEVTQLMQDILKALGHGAVYSSVLIKKFNLPNIEVLRILEQEGLIDSISIRIERTTRKYYFLTELGYLTAVSLGLVSGTYEQYRKELFKNHALFTNLAKRTYGSNVRKVGIGKRRPDLIHYLKDEHGTERVVHVEYERTNPWNIILDHIVQSLSGETIDGVLILVDSSGDDLDYYIQVLKDKIKTEWKDLFVKLTGILSVMNVGDYLRGKLTSFEDFKAKAIWENHFKRKIIPVKLIVKKDPQSRELKYAYLRCITNTGDSFILSFSVNITFMRGDRPTTMSVADRVVGKIVYNGRGRREELHFNDPEPIEKYTYIRYLIEYIIMNDDKRFGLNRAIALIIDKLYPKSVKQILTGPLIGESIPIVTLKIDGKKVKFCLKCASSLCIHTKLAA